MKIKELIVVPVTTCSLSTDVAEARDLMKLNKISALPIVGNQDGQVKIEGIVSYHDLVGVYDDNVNIQQVMSTKIFAVTPDTTIQIAAKIMISKNIHHLVALDKDNLVGIVSSLDFVKLVAESSI